MIRLTAEQVETTFADCLFSDDEPITPRIEAEGIMSTAGFHPGRIEDNYPTIATMLEQLPEAFQQALGGGWSFLNACMTKDGSQWTGMHQTQEHLFQLGMAAGRVKCMAPRDLWPAFPGGMPYYAVTTDRFDVPLVTTESEDEVPR